MNRITVVENVEKRSIKRIKVFSGEIKGFQNKPHERQNHTITYRNNKYTHQKYLNGF